MREVSIQEAVARWLDASGVRWCHVPNGEFRDPRTARRLKAQGVKPGVPDVLIFESPPNAPMAVGAALELKTEDGRASRGQKDWLDALRLNLWEVAVVHGPDEAAAKLREWGYIG